jgi:hypothetical protein
MIKIISHGSKLSQRERSLGFINDARKRAKEEIEAISIGIS